MYKKVWCTCGLVVLPIFTYCFLAIVVAVAVVVAKAPYQPLTMRVTGVSSLTLISWFKFLGSLDKLKSITHLVCLVLTCWVFWLQHEPCIVTERKDTVIITVSFCLSSLLYFLFCVSWLAFMDIVRELFAQSDKICKDHFDAVFLYQRVCSFGMIQIRISDPRSLGSWSIKWTNESTLDKDSNTKSLSYSVSWCSLFRFRKQYINFLLSVFFYMSNILSFGNHEKDSSFLNEKYTI